MQTVQELHQVTIVFMGSEVAYGEGEGFGYAFEEAVEGLPYEYEQHLEHLEVIHLRSEQDTDKTHTEYLPTVRKILSFDDAVKIIC